MRMFSLSRPVAVALALLAAATAARAESPWTLISFFDDINAATVGIAAVQNDEAFGLNVHGASHETRIWATFLLPTDASVAIDGSRDLTWQIAGGPRFSLDAVTREIAGRSGNRPQELHHAGPNYVSFVIRDAGAPLAAASALRGLIEGGRLRMRYPLAGGGEAQTDFSLDGAGAAITRLMVLLGDIPAARAGSAATRAATRAATGVATGAAGQAAN